MSKLLGMIAIVVGLTTQPTIAQCFPGSDDALSITSWSITKTIGGQDLRILLAYDGKFGAKAVTGVNGLVRFGSTTGEKFELGLDVMTSIAPGDEGVEQRYAMTGWDRLIATPRAWITVEVCVYSMDFADGGGVIFN